MFNRAQLRAINGKIKPFSIDSPMSEDDTTSVTMVITDIIGYSLHYADIYFARALSQSKRHLFLFKNCVLSLCQTLIEFASVIISEHPSPRIFVLSPPVLTAPICRHLGRSSPFPVPPAAVWMLSCCCSVLIKRGFTCQSRNKALLVQILWKYNSDKFS